MVFATIVAICVVVLGAATAFAQQEREEVMVVIPMDHMSAATAAQLFGGQVVAPSPMYGQNSFGNRGTIGGGYQSGPSIGGDHSDFNRGQSSFDRSNSSIR
ncbi:MAG: hypothetical protein ACOCZ7_04885 [Armatimonadota bacterium]